MCTAASELCRANPGREEWARLVEAAHANGCACHGDLDLTLDQFAAKLAAIAEKCLPVESEWPARIEFLSQLHTKDLFLATACAYHREQAWRRFEALYRKYLNDLVHYLCSVTNLESELVDSLVIDLFLPDRSGRSRISSYDGRSSMATWLRVIVSNRVVNEGQRKCNSVHRTEVSPDLVDAGALLRIESSLKIDRYEALIDSSLRTACSALSPKEKLMLLWRFDDGLQLGEIAQYLGVHQSTVTRGLERIAKRLRESAVHTLAEKYQLNAAAIEECLSVLFDGASHSVSILTLIREANPRPEGSTDQPETSPRPAGGY